MTLDVTMTASVLETEDRLAPFSDQVKEDIV